MGKNSEKNKYDNEQQIKIKEPTTRVINSSQNKVVENKQCVINNVGF